MQATIKNVIYEKARKDRTFIRILKECNLYKRYFFMLKNYGMSSPAASVSLKDGMASYVMNGFGWSHDHFRHIVWSNLYCMLEKGEFKTDKGIGLYRDIRNSECYKHIIAD